MMIMIDSSTRWDRMYYELVVVTTSFLCCFGMLDGHLAPLLPLVIM